jgi:predicted esterase
MQGQRVISLEIFGKILLIFFVGVPLLFSFSSNQCKDKPFEKIHLSDTTIVLNNVSVDILFPSEKPVGYILVLPGWNFSRKDVCTHSEFCSLAKKSGYCLILPEMGKSAYLNKCFKETRAEWLIYPTLKWVLDTLIPYCQNSFRILLKNQDNFLFGISTGGRGVAQIALNTGKLFKAGASLSGDFNPSIWKDDKLMIGYLGPYEQFPERWNGEDNPSVHAARLMIPLFLGHGKADKVVPVDQTLSFYQKISSLGPKAGHTVHLEENAGHNWDYWNSEMERIFAFFHEKSLKR